VASGLGLELPRLAGAGERSTAEQRDGDDRAAGQDGGRPPETLL
jgi:hypothetical protein